MQAMFVIPTLVSESVPDRLVPLLTKLVERNIAINYRNTFQRAIQSIVRREDLDIQGDPLLEDSWDDELEETRGVLKNISDRLKKTSEDYKKVKNKAKKDSIERYIKVLSTVEKSYRDREKNLSDLIKEKGKEKQEEIKERKEKLDKRWETTKNAFEWIIGSGNKEDIKKREERSKISDPRIRGAVSVKDQVDIPTGVVFFRDIGLEPTIIEIQMGEQTYVVGFKSVAYRLKNVETIINTMMKYGQGGLLNFVTRFIRSKKNLILRKMFGWIRRRIKVTAEDPINDIKFSPTLSDLAKPKYLAKNIKSSGATGWASLVVVTTDDFEESEADMEHFFKIYTRLVNSGWGDVLVVDVNQEKVNYCSMVLKSCSQIPFSYLQKLFNLDNVLDFSELNKFARGPFSKSPLRSFVRENSLK